MRVQAMRLLGLGHILEKNYSAAIDIFKNELDLLHDKNTNEHTIPVLLNDLGIAYLNADHFDLAEQYFRDALEKEISRNDVEGIMVSKSGLADIFLERKEWQLAEVAARESLEYAERLGRQTGIAANCIRIATALLNQGNPSKGSAFARRAVEIYTNLRISSGTKEAQDLLAYCASAMQTDTEQEL
jgi:tetratricopeptide (TPR) repeat protein